jgi:arginine decarboxylase
MADRQPPNHAITCGGAEGITEQNALDAARLQSSVGNSCLVHAEIVVPPGSRLVEAATPPAGEIVPATWASFCSNTPGEVISAGVAVAYPADESQPAVTMQYAASGHKENIEAIARLMAEEGLRQRGLELKIIHSVAVQHRVEQTGAVFAAIVLV